VSDSNRIRHRFFAERAAICLVRQNRRLHQKSTGTEGLARRSTRKRDCPNDRAWHDIRDLSKASGIRPSAIRRQSFTGPAPLSLQRHNVERIFQRRVAHVVHPEAVAREKVSRCLGIERLVDRDRAVQLLAMSCSAARAQLI